MIIINQGKPATGYFTVLQPVPGNKIKIGDQVKCIDPKTKREASGVCVDFWVWEWIRLPDSFCLLTYGVDALTLKTAIEKKKEFRDKTQVSFLLIKETAE